MDTSVDTGATAAVASFAVDGGAGGAGHVAPLQRVLVDTVGSALAGTGTTAELLVRRWSEAEGSTGRSTVWTTGRAASAAGAALVNGTAAHALDWDDVSPGSAMHPSAVLIPALLAVAEERGLGGDAVVRAHDVGAAVFRALTQALPRAVHYERGWHTTSTVGRLAAAASLATLVGLDERRTRWALGLAGSLAAGSLANFGTMTKPLHAGLAARDGVMAVALAASGFTANPNVLEARGGFFELFGERNGARIEALAAELARWREAWPTDWAQKRHPACYATHRAIDAGLEVRADLGGRLPRNVRVTTEPGGLRPLLPGVPVDGTSAKFSMAYVVAVALVHGAVRLEHFRDQALADPRVRELMSVVSAVEADHPPVGAAGYRDGFTVLEVDRGDGGTSHARVDITYGDSSRPLSHTDLENKLIECCLAGGLTRASADDLAEVLLQLPTAPEPRRLSEVLDRSGHISEVDE